MTLRRKKNGKYVSLCPTLTDDGVWVIGKRFMSHNLIALQVGDKPQSILAASHPYTRLLMHEAHVSSGHRGPDATLARYRHKYWTPYGSKMAKFVKDKCYLCRRREPKFLEQEMGNLPPRTY